MIGMRAAHLVGKIRHDNPKRPEQSVDEYLSETWEQAIKQAREELGLEVEEGPVRRRGGEMMSWEEAFKLGPSPRLRKMKERYTRS